MRFRLSVKLQDLRYPALPSALVSVINQLDQQPHFIKIDGGMEIVPILDLDDTQDVMYAELHEPLDRERCRESRYEHVGDCKLLKDLGR